MLASARHRQEPTVVTPRLGAACRPAAATLSTHAQPFPCPRPLRSVATAAALAPCASATAGGIASAGRAIAAPPPVPANAARPGGSSPTMATAARCVPFLLSAVRPRGANERLQADRVRGSPLCSSATPPPRHPAPTQCGSACPAGSTCKNGVCTPRCIAPQIECNGGPLYLQAVG